ncbi:LysR family transcriptional regulator [Actinokineospora globicatena]|uniref:LysR family transcriptional regulator n=1 Tax=Actinokineospora globicatena TaxID=103729 RepID=UPI0020A5CAFF|nr:LysR substrate-binding domain-containing protein [Actinokineospora globicatena]MCP2305480.1 DNA-binding transcriptional regulator, LysR family [Actinokineospora globicatena]GLW81348.1 LysR family transcriptional regulator [Actinokineospora globicatena]GLW87954.1 LysR family transcriptional regulator [Actinokineospora globicatena]
MTLQQLVYFLAVAQTRHFTRAAQRAHVAQPSLSKQIHGLETELGAALFTRARGNVTLTAAGEALLPIAKRILSDVDSARLEVAELVGLRQGRIRLGATPSVCVGVLADVLRRYHDRYPGIRLQVEESGSRDLTSALLGGELDLALLIVRPQGVESALTMTPVLREHLMVASSAAEAALPSGIRLESLRDRPMVMFRSGYDLRETTLQACRAAGFEPELAVEGGEMDAVLRFVEAGLGVALVPSLVLPGRPGLRATPLTSPNIRRTIALAHRTDTPPTAAARAFRSTLFGHIDALVAANALPPGVEPLR